MSVYTVQLRYLVENKYPIFDFDYPIFDEKYRKVLEQKIIDRYYFREIGFETSAQFKHYLKTKLNEIMPYYNQLYQSEMVFNKIENPLYNVDTTETQTRDIKQDSQSTTTGESDSTNSSNSKNVFQDTPQSRLNDVNYATSINEDDGTSTANANVTSNNDSTANTTETYIKKMTGSAGFRYPSEIIMEWRKAFLNIDLQILEELNELFMGVY